MRGKKSDWGKRTVVFLLAFIVAAFSGGSLTAFAGDTTTITGTITDPADTPGEPEPQPEYSLSKTSRTMAPATTSTLKLKGVSATKVKWKSSKKTVATVDNKGKVTARAKGTAEIRAVYQGKTYKCKVSVKYKTYTAKDGITYKDVKGDFGRTGRWFSSRSRRIR